MKKYLKEDKTIFNVNRQQTGIKKSESIVKPATVGDILKANNTDDTAPRLKPYPLDRFDNISTDAFVTMLNLRKIVDTARNNPDIEKKYKEKLILASKTLEKISKELVELSNIIDTIG